jgi:MGT family glycosyltransferase
MAKIALVYTPMGGHAGPIRRLGGVLVRAGHEVVEVPSLEGHVLDGSVLATTRELGVPPRPIVEPLGDFAEIAAAVAFMAHQAAPYTTEALLAANVDLVVYDVTAPWGRLAARWLGLPAISSWPLFPGEYTEEDKLDLKPSPDHHTFIEKAHAILEDIRATWGVDLGEWHDILANTGDRNLLFTTPEILGDEQLGESWRLIGPLMDAAPAAHEPLLADWGDEPLVYMAMGTMYTQRHDLFAATLEAAADLPVRLLLSTWGRFTAEDLAPIPANARVAASVDSRAVLREAQVHVTHGGGSSVHESLIEGVPMLCLPQGADQRRWSRRATAVGAAEVLQAETAEAIREGIVRLLDDRSMADRAREVGRSLAEYDGARIAAQAVEELLG